MDPNSPPVPFSEADGGTNAGRVRVRPCPDRRRHPPLDHLAGRIRQEYLEMPGLHLDTTQAARLLGVDGRCCRQVLDGCVADGWLCSEPGGLYSLTHLT